MSILPPEIASKLASDIILENRMKLLSPKDLVDVLSEEEKLVITCKGESAGNNWNNLREFITERLKRPPYIEELFFKLKQNLVRIAQFELYEERYGLNLYELLNKNGKL